MADLVTDDGLADTALGNGVGTELGKDNTERVLAREKARNVKSDVTSQVHLQRAVAVGDARRGVVDDSGIGRGR